MSRNYHSRWFVSITRSHVPRNYSCVCKWEWLWFFYTATERISARSILRCCDPVCRTGQFSKTCTINLVGQSFHLMDRNSMPAVKMGTCCFLFIPYVLRVHETVHQKRLCRLWKGRMCGLCHSQLWSKWGQVFNHLVKGLTKLFLMCSCNSCVTV